jgi:uncharacterized membrane protein HdeD (DUF308 family)
MLFFAFWLPRITAAMMATFFTGFALLDGLVALAAAGWGLVRGGRWRLLACKGLTGAAAGLAVVRRPPGQRPGPLAIFAWWAIITGLLQAVEALCLGRGHEGRPYLAAIAVVAVAFGVLILARPPQDLITLAALPAYSCAPSGFNFRAGHFHVISIRRGHSGAFRGFPGSRSTSWNRARNPGKP